MGKQNTNATAVLFVMLTFVCIECCHHGTAGHEQDNGSHQENGDQFPADSNFNQRDQHGSNMVPSIGNAFYSRDNEQDGGNNEDGSFHFGNGQPGSNGGFGHRHFNGQGENENQFGPGNFGDGQGDTQGGNGGSDSRGRRQGGFAGNFNNGGKK